MWRGEGAAGFVLVVAVVVRVGVIVVVLVVVAVALAGVVAAVAGAKRKRVRASHGARAGPRPCGEEIFIQRGEGISFHMLGLGRYGLHRLLLLRLCDWRERPRRQRLRRFTSVLRALREVDCDDKLLFRELAVPISVRERPDIFKHFVWRV